MSNHGQTMVYVPYYTSTYTRAQPYIYGILIGYLLFKMRGKTLDIHWVKIHKNELCTLTKK